MSVLYDKAIVAKRNVLNELRSNNMTVQELRFFSIYLSKINPKDKSTRCVCFPLEDFQRIMGFGRLNIKQLKASTDSLLCKLVHVPDDNGRGWSVFQLFKECHIFQDEDNQWFVEIDAHDKALPLMFDFKNRYFKYELWNALRLKSPNQVRMYEILKQWIHDKPSFSKEFKITELRALLGIANSEYSNRTGWSDFKKKVLDSCQEALKESTDICYTYERGKVGRGGKWLSVIFHIQKNTEYVDQLTLDEFIEMQPNSEMIDVSTEESEIDYGGELAGQISSFDDDNAPDQSEEYEDEEEKWVKIYGSERMAELAEACRYEFDKDQMRVIFDKLRDLPIPPDRQTDNRHFGKVNWLNDLYNKFLVAVRRSELYGNPVKEKYRFNYFCRMIENYYEVK